MRDYVSTRLHSRVYMISIQAIKRTMKSILLQARQWADKL